MSTFIEREDTKFAIQLVNFGEKLPNYATALGLSTAQIASAQADAEFFSFLVGVVVPIRDWSKSASDYKDLARYGRGTDPMGAFPAAPTFTAPALVGANIEERFSNLAGTIKRNANYTKAIGEDLGIEKTSAPFDPTTGKPTFKIFTDSGHPVLKWVKGKYDGVEIWVNRGSGWAVLQRDNKSPHADTHPLPAAGQSAVWKYKMIYLLNDNTIGNWGDEASVTVYGAV